MPRGKEPLSQTVRERQIPDKKRERETSIPSLFEVLIELTQNTQNTAAEQIEKS